MKKFYVFAIVALGALAVSTSCKKDKSEECFTTCGEEVCKDDYEEEMAEAKADGESFDMTWDQYKSMIKAFESEFGCEE